MNLQTILVLLIGTCAMMVPMFFQAKKYSIKEWKIVPVSFVLTLIGTLGTYLWFLLENFEFGGRSFYGAVFLVPIVFLLFARIIRIPYRLLMDFCAPAECVMLSFMKIKCLMDGCCAGRILWISDIGHAVRFPSQLTELLVAYLLGWGLLMMSYRIGFCGKIYPWYLILYGSSRFVLNFFRDEWAAYDSGIPPLGTVWSLCAVVIGILWLIIDNKRKNLLEQKSVSH